jgi:protein-L-isoaspartate(D-aspartate) O-methyltransferase
MSLPEFSEAGVALDIYLILGGAVFVGWAVLVLWGAGAIALSACRGGEWRSSYAGAVFAGGKLRSGSIVQECFAIGVAFRRAARPTARNRFRAGEKRGSTGHRRREHRRMAQPRHMRQAGARDGCRIGRWLIATAIAIISGLAVSTMPATAADLDYAVERAAMIRTIAMYAAEVSSATGHDRIAPRVLEAMGIVPRHEFVPEAVRGQAYADRPLPIGYGQTISQPFIVAVMTDLLQVAPDHVVLEIGTGSGYQAAVLAHLAHQVYTIEIVPGLANNAAQRLQSLGYANVATRLGDGYYGWQEAAPFDGIIVTAVASQIPPPLIQQLKAGGRMVMPIGAPFALQHLVVVEVDDERKVRTRQLLPVAFVPFAGRH